MLEFNLTFFIISIGVLQIEMILAWKFVNRMSDLMTTALDLINADTIISHNLMVSTVLLLYYMASLVNEDFVFSHFVALAVGIWFQIIFGTSFAYYSMGISLRYFLIWQRTTDPIEGWTDQDIRKWARLLAWSIGIIPISLHVYFSGYTRFYPELTGFEIRDVRGIIISLPILFIAITVNVPFKILIAMEKNQMCNHYQNSTTSDLKTAKAM